MVPHCLLQCTSELLQRRPNCSLPCSIACIFAGYPRTTHFPRSCCLGAALSKHASGCLVAHVCARCLRRLAPKHEALQEGVAGQAVGPVQPGACCLPARKQPGKARLRVGPSAHTAAGVVHGRGHGDGLGGDVDAVRQTLASDVGEVSEERLPWEVGHIQEGALLSAQLALVVDAARNHVARRQLQPLVVLLHEALARTVEQHPALPTHRFRDEEDAAPPLAPTRRRRLCFGHVQAGWVELHELHVADHRPGTRRHSHAVSRRHQRVGGAGVDVPRAARREQGGRGQESNFAARVAVEGVAAEAVSRTLHLVRHQVRGKVVLVQEDVAVAPHLGQQGSLNLRAREVGSVHDALVLVAALARQVEPAVLRFIKFGTHCNQIQHRLGPFTAHELHHFFVT
mmetsp:Transcript_27736/g.52775  ORF Transcript_27736/g.52775 Transcript_27736/m.52775 type:complete len:398 (+) Transcript_27736:2291-3484(+)